MRALLAELEGLPPGDAVFDLDGTLIAGDIGEAVLRRVAAAGHRSATTAADADPWATYLALPSYEAQCAYAAQALGGLALGQVERFVDAAFAEGDVAPIPETCELAHALSVRHRVWILTGSAEVLGRLAGARLGLRDVMGLRLGWSGDRLTEAVVPPITCGEGKVRAIDARLGRRPVFAIGDSPHDLPLLRVAGVARTTGRSAGMEFPAYPAT